MIKKQQPVQKNNKAKSKQSEKSRDHNIYSHKQLPETRDITVLGYLEKRLNEEIKMRQQGEVRILEMIRYLDQTKKSKIPIQFEKLVPKKLLSPNTVNYSDNPNRNVTAPVIPAENQQIPHIKAEIAQLSSQKQLYEQENNRKINRLITEIEQMRDNVRNSQFEEVEQMRIQLNEFMDQLEKVRKDIQESIDLLNEKIQKKISERETFFDEFNSKFDNQSTLTQRLGIQVSKFVPSIESIGQILTKLQQKITIIDNTVVNQLSKIQEQVNKSTESVTSTQQALQSIVYNRSKQNSNTSPIEQKIDGLAARLASTERRIDLIYHQYLSSSVKGKQKKEKN